MASIDKIMEKLPDMYFDWYARLLPGILGVLVFLLRAPDEQRIYASNHVLVMLIIAYVTGHFIQPASSWCVKTMEKRKGNEQIYSTYKRDRDCKEDLVGKVSKAHAEAISMCSAAILITLLIIYYVFITCSLDCPLIVAVVALCMLTVERVNARNRKILDLKKE